jgi:hypothetical protein
LELEHPILVVLNKADKKTAKDVDALVQKTKENLIEQHIAFYDVVGYSSSKGIEYSSSQDVIQTYLNTISKNIRGTKILKQIQNSYKLYVDYYDSQLVEYRATRGVFNELMMKEAVDDVYADAIQTLSQKRIKQIKHIENAKKSIAKQQERFLEVVTKLLKQYNIENLDYKKEYIFDKELYKAKKVETKVRDVRRFSASLNLKDTSELLRYKDLDTIEASIYKVSSIGVFIKIAGVNGDIMLSKSSILKEENISDIKTVFKENSKVLVQILKNKKCIVIK